MVTNFWDRIGKIAISYLTFIHRTDKGPDFLMARGLLHGGQRNVTYRENMTSAM